MLDLFIKKIKRFIDKNLEVYESNKSKASKIGSQIASSVDSANLFCEKYKNDSLEEKLKGISSLADKNASLVSSINSTLDEITSSKPGFIASALLFNQAINSYWSKKKTLQQEFYLKNSYGSNYTINMKNYITNYSAGNQEDKYFSKLAEVLSGNYVDFNGKQRRKARWDTRLKDLDKLLNQPFKRSSKFDKKLEELKYVLKTNNYLRKNKPEIYKTLDVKLGLLNQHCYSKTVMNNCYVST